MSKIDTREEDLKGFLNHFQQKRYPKDEEIVGPGDAADTLYYIVEGSLVVALEDDSGQEVILAYLKPGEFLGEMGLFMEQSTRNALVRTRTETVLAEISYDEASKIINGPDTSGALAMMIGIGAQLSDRLLKTSRQVGLLAFHDVTGRIARTLLDMCDQPEAKSLPEGVRIPVTREEISGIVSCSIEMAARVLVILQQQGLITLEDNEFIVIHRTA